MPVPLAPAELLQLFGPRTPLSSGLRRVAGFMGWLQVGGAVTPTEVARDYVVNLIRSRAAAQVADI